MPCLRVFGALAFAAVAIVAAPTQVASQTTTDKGEQRTKAAAQDAKTRISDSWLTASDEDITRLVEDRLSKDARLKKVDVRTDGGAVTLTGAVPSIGASARASELARGVPGVRSVKNELTYDPAKRDGARAPTTVGK